MHVDTMRGPGLQVGYIFVFKAIYKFTKLYCISCDVQNQTNPN